MLERKIDRNACKQTGDGDQHAAGGNHQVNCKDYQRSNEENHCYRKGCHDGSYPRFGASHRS
ncbi:MAG: hypothetical protein RL069_180, partial [Planctomycetota bacterium]